SGLRPRHLRFHGRRSRKVCASSRWSPSGPRPCPACSLAPNVSRHLSARFPAAGSTSRYSQPVSWSGRSNPSTRFRRALPTCTTPLKSRGPAVPPRSLTFCNVPFGLTPSEINAWIYHGGGQALWDELSAGFGLKPLMCGNTGPQMGGWFTKELTGVESYKGLRYRMPGVGGDVLRRLGAVVVNLPASEIIP